MSVNVQVLTAEALEALYSAEVLSLVREYVGIPDLTADSLGEIRSLPEVARLVKDFLSSKRKEEDVPMWAREVGITADEWGSSLVGLQALRTVERRFAEEKNAAAVAYKAALTAIEGRRNASLPTYASDKVARLVKARRACFDDLPLRDRARVMLRVRGVTNDERSVIISSALLEYRRQLFRA